MAPRSLILCCDEAIEGLSQRRRCGRIAPRPLGHCTVDCVQHLVGLYLVHLRVHFMGQFNGQFQGPLQGKGVMRDRFENLALQLVGNLVRWLPPGAARSVARGLGRMAWRLGYPATCYR